MEKRNCFLSQSQEEKQDSLEMSSLCAISVVSSYLFPNQISEVCASEYAFPVQILENEGVDLSQKRRALHHTNLKRIPATDSCSRNSDEMVGKGQSTQAKASYPAAICAFTSGFNLLHSEGVGLHLASGRVPRMSETKAMDRVYLETRKTNNIFLFLSSMPNPALGSRCISFPAAFPL